MSQANRPYPMIYLMYVIVVHRHGHCSTATHLSIHTKERPVGIQVFKLPKSSTVKSWSDMKRKLEKGETKFAINYHTGYSEHKTPMTLNKIEGEDNQIVFTDDKGRCQVILGMAFDREVETEKGDIWDYRILTLGKRGWKIEGFNSPLVLKQVEQVNRLSPKEQRHQVGPTQSTARGMRLLFAGLMVAPERSMGCSK